MRRTPQIFQRLLCALTGLSVLCGICGEGIAQAYPVKPVRLIIPFPAGAAADTVGRTFAARFAEIWGQQVIADNRGGANTI